MSTERPKVGPADPETRRKKLRETLDSEAASRKAELADEARGRNEERRAKKAKGKTSTLKQLLDPKAARDRTVGGENTSIMEAVKEGVRQGSDKKRK